MGLLDFFSKNDSQNPQGGTSSTPVPDFASIQQSYTNQSLANVSYPMANPGNPAPVSATPVTPQSNITQDQAQQYPGLPATMAPQQTSPMPVSPEPRDLMDPNPQPQYSMPQQNVTDMNPMPTAPMIPNPIPEQEEKDIPSYEYVDPSKHPVLPEVTPDQSHTETMPEGIKVITYETQNQQSQLPQQNSVQTEQQTDPSQSVESNLTTNSDTNSMLEQGTLPEQLPNNEFNSTTEVSNSSVLPDQSLQMPQSEAVSEISQPTELQMPSTENVEPVADSTLPQPETPVEQSTEVTTPEIEIGVGSQSMPVLADASTNMAQSSDFQVPSAEPTAPESNLELNSTIEAPEASSNVDLPSTTEVAENTGLQMDQMQEAQITDENKNSADDSDASKMVVNPQVDSVVENTAKVESAPDASPAELEISYFRTVGFIGLNTQQPNLKVVEKVKELSDKLSEKVEVFILDSAKGYAKGIFDSAKSHGIELMGMYLKPFHSNYTDEAELGEYENFTIMMFSNSGDKIKNIIKESDLLVMPEIYGLANVSTLFDIWATSSMYPGQNKPIILLGKGWTSILSQMKNLFKLSDSDLKFVNVCQTTDEAIVRINELDKELVSREVKQPKKVIDLREEDDEDGLFV